MILRIYLETAYFAETGNFLLKVCKKKKKKKKEKKSKKLTFGAMRPTIGAKISYKVK